MKVGEEIEFNIYGYTVKGIFIKKEKQKIIIKTTDDYIDKIGEEQSIHESHLKGKKQ